MDSNEEYLDQLLKSLTEGDSAAATGRDGDSDQDDGLGDLLNQFSDEMESVPEDLLSGLLGGSGSVADGPADTAQMSLFDMTGEMKEPTVQSGTLSESPESAQSGTLGELADSVQSGTLGEAAESVQSETLSELAESVQSGTLGEAAESVQFGTQGESVESVQSGTQGESAESVQFGTQGESVGSVQSGTLEEPAASVQPELLGGESAASARPGTLEEEEFVQPEIMVEDSESFLLPEDVLPEEPDRELPFGLSDSEASDPFVSAALEPSVSSDMSEQYSSDLEEDDLGSLLESLGSDGDEDVREISELLDRADRNEPIDDTVDTLMQGLGSDLQQDGALPEEAEEPAGKRGRKKKKERVKKEKKPKREKKKRKGQDPVETLSEDAVDGAAEKEADPESAGQDTGDDLPPEVKDREKKQGFWGKLLNALTQEEESGEDPADLVSDENGEILKQLDQEKKNKAKGKKKKKGKEQKAAGAEGDREFDEDAPDEKPKKKKKEKKPKKEKPPVPVEEMLPGRKLSLKKVLPIVIVALVFCLAYVLISHLYIDYVNRQRAESAYYSEDYLECYTLLFGQQLNESQASMYHRSELILQMERMKGNYRRLVMEGKELEALDYLVQCIFRKEKFYLQGQEWNSLDVVDATFTDMTGLLVANYGLTEEQAVEIAVLESDVDYTLALMDVLEGPRGSTPEEEAGQQNPADFYEDLLPEEEEDVDAEFIDTIQKTE